MMMMMITRRVVRGSGIQGRTLPRLEDIALWGVIVFFLLHFFLFPHLTHPNIVVRPVMMMRMRKSEVHIQELGSVGRPWGRFSHFDEKHQSTFSSSVPSPSQTFSPVTLRSWDWRPVSV